MLIFEFRTFTPGKACHQTSCSLIVHHVNGHDEVVKLSPWRYVYDVFITVKTSKI